MLKYLLDLRIYDEHGDEILAASTPNKRREPEETPEHAFADFKNLIHMLRMMKSQKDHGGSALWEFEIDPESAKAELFHKMLRLIR